MARTLTLETILRDTLWVAKMQGWRGVGHLIESEECRDVDLAAQQPEHLKEFYDMYFAHEGFITVQDFWYWYYSPAMNAKEEEAVWE